MRRRPLAPQLPSAAAVGAAPRSAGGLPLLLPGDGEVVAPQPAADAAVLLPAVTAAAVAAMGDHLVNLVCGGQAGTDVTEMMMTLPPGRQLGVAVAIFAVAVVLVVAVAIFAVAVVAVAVADVVEGALAWPFFVWGGG